MQLDMELRDRMAHHLLVIWANNEKRIDQMAQEEDRDFTDYEYALLSTVASTYFQFIERHPRRNK
jgi:hypothetical protein